MPWLYPKFLRCTVCLAALRWLFYLRLSVGYGVISSHLNAAEWNYCRWDLFSCNFLQEQSQPSGMVGVTVYERGGGKDALFVSR